jgi:hypothetical protein
VKEKTMTPTQEAIYRYHRQGPMRWLDLYHLLVQDGLAFTLRGTPLQRHGRGMLHAIQGTHYAMLRTGYPKAEAQAMSESYTTLSGKLAWE